MRLKRYISGADYIAEEIDRRIIEDLLNRPEWQHLRNNGNNIAVDTKQLNYD